MKSRMRSALESAQTKIGDVVETRGLLNESHSTMDLTVTETIARHRDIERIEEEGFHQSTFVSSSGGAGGRVRKEVHLKFLLDNKVRVLFQFLNLFKEIVFEY